VNSASYPAQLEARSSRLSRRLLLTLLALAPAAWADIYTLPGNATWTCPANVFSVQVEAWGAGGGGGGCADNFTCAGGGAGGCYVRYTVTVTPGTVYNLTVGAGGAAGGTTTSTDNGGNGGASYFGNTTAGNPAGALVLALGGGGGYATNTAGSEFDRTAGAAGGTAITTGNLPSSGATANTAGTSGGTSAATNGVGSGTSGAGGAGAGAINGLGAGGAAVTCAGSSLAGVSGTAPGGGGSGAANYTATRFGGAGGAGQVALTYPHIPGLTYYGRSNYVGYIAGDMPVIFSAPHGGWLTPAEIPDRTNCTTCSGWDFTTVTDENTADVAAALQIVFRSYFGHCPHVIICNLQRTKIDCNRDVAEGAENNAYAVQAWNEFHDFINTASSTILANAGKGLYVDLHGEGHPIERLELGYLLTGSQLTNTDATLDSSFYEDQSSIRAVSHRLPLSGSFSELLRGPDSFGGLMYAQGYPSVPSPLMPSPGNGTNPIVYPGDQNPYFNGGYNTVVHGSMNGGAIDGIQLEANYDGVRDTPNDITNYAAAITQTVDAFFTNYYDFDLRLSAPCVWAVGAGNWADANNWGGTLPVSGNYLDFAGPGGAANHNLKALATGNGVIYSITFDASATGSYSLYGNPMTLTAGIMNQSSFTQTLSNAVTMTAAQTIAASSGALVFAGGIITGGNQLTLAGGAGLTFNGVISGGGSLVLSGTGTSVLAAANTFMGGVTVNRGVLLANNSSGGSGTGSGAVIVNANATLGGSGTIAGPVSVSGSISPGPGAGQLTLGNGLDLSGGGTYAWELAANNTNLPGLNYSVLAVTGGNLVLGGASTLAIAFTGSATPPDANSAFWQAAHSWKVVSLSGTAANPGQSNFSSLANATFAAGAFSTWVDASGNVALVFLPAAAPAPQIESAAAAAGGDFVLTFTTVANRLYVLEFTPDLQNSNWVSLATNQAPGGFLTLTNVMGAGSRGFYRIRVWP
jgi:hypothetical protein